MIALALLKKGFAWLVGSVPWQAWLVAGVVAALSLGAWWIDAAAYERGRGVERQAAVIAAGKRIIEMEKNNEAFRALPARDRCLAFMRDSGLPAEHCD